MTKYRKTICVDFDGVLNQYHGSGDSNWMQVADGAPEFLKWLNNHGWTVVIHSAREPWDIEQWLTRNELAHLVDLVTNKKVPAMIYLDDRGITFTGDFEKAKEAINGFSTWWEAPYILGDDKGECEQVENR